MKLSVEERRQIVRDEVAAYRQRDRSADWKDEFNWLNNFDNNLPWPMISQDGVSWRRTAERAGFLDRTYGEVDTARRVHPGNSDLKMNNTFRHFYEAIDAAIAQLGISEELQRIQTEYLTYKREHPGLHGEEYNEFVKIVNKLCEFILPVYVELRVQGYTDYDLTA